MICRMCGRKIKTSASKKYDMGPLCFKKYKRLQEGNLFEGIKNETINL